MADAKEKKSDRRVLKTKTAIMDAYSKLLFEHKGKRITVAEIARIADIDRKTFYLHYDSVDDVLRAFCETRIQELVDCMEEVDFFQEPIGKMEIVFQKLHGILSRDAQFYQHLAGNINYDFFWDAVNEIMVSTLVNVYKDQVKVDLEALNIYCEFFISGILHNYQSFLKNPEKVSMESISLIIADILKNGAMNLF